MHRLETALPRILLIAQFPLWLLTICVVVFTNAEGAPFAAAAGTATVIGYVGRFVGPLVSAYRCGYRAGFEDALAECPACRTQFDEAYPTDEVGAEVVPFRR